MHIDGFFEIDSEMNCEYLLQHNSSQYLWPHFEIDLEWGYFQQAGDVLLGS
jgi:hypothetical protein